ncbi:MAG: 2-dehydropantoate 2-reductase [Acidimicrobiales bacterium]|nr:MAG: 2-dehydropantoate 2-reductase [Acidimicrobiales bacterium]
MVPCVSTGARSYVFIGAGAVGGLYGARLASAGHRVCFLVRRDAEVIRRRGITVVGPTETIVIHPAHVTCAVDDLTGPDVVPDVVVVATKTNSNLEIREAVARLLRPGSILVLMQNGLDVEDDFADVASGSTVLGALCFVCAERVDAGLVLHRDFGTVTLAEFRADRSAAGVTEPVEAVAGDLERAGVKTVRYPDLVEARWRKLVWNVPYNGLSVVLRAGTDELNGHPRTRGLVRDLMSEVIALARADGRTVPTEFADEMLDATDRMIPYLPSMRRDFEAGHPMELDAIYERPLRRARDLGVDVPLVSALAAQLAFLQERRSGRRLEGDGPAPVVTR